MYSGVYSRLISRFYVGFVTMNAACVVLPPVCDIILALRTEYCSTAGRSMN
jgi:hypothetical protein